VRQLESHGIGGERAGSTFMSARGSRWCVRSSTIAEANNSAGSLKPLQLMPPDRSGMRRREEISEAVRTSAEVSP